MIALQSAAFAAAAVAIAAIAISLPRPAAISQSVSQSGSMMDDFYFRNGGEGGIFTVKATSKKRLRSMVHFGFTMAW